MDMQKVAELRKKANTLPMEPGVYLMRDRRGEIIYVGTGLTHELSGVQTGFCRYRW